MNYKEIIEKVGTTFLLTVAAYFVAYIFEVSYLRSFGISWQAARVTISSLIVSFIVLISLGVCLNPLLGLFIGIPKKIKTEMERFVYERVFEFVVVFVVFVFWLFISTTKVDICLLLAIAAFVPAAKIFVWVLSLFRFRSIRPFKKMLIESFRAFNESERKSSELSGFEKLKIIKAHNRLFSVTVIVFSLAYIAGYYMSATIRPTRAFVVDNHRYAVIRDYDGMIVAKEIVNDRIGEKYMYIDSSQNKLVFYPIRVDKGIIQ